MNPSHLLIGEPPQKDHPIGPQPSEIENPNPAVAAESNDDSMANFSVNPNPFLVVGPAMDHG